MQISAVFEHEGIKYPVIITKKRQKRVIVRYNGVEFLVSAPKFCTKALIMHTAKPAFEKLLKKQKCEVHDENNGINGLYIFGEFHPIDDGFIDVLGHQILFVNLNDFYKKIMKIVSPKIEELFRECEVDINSEKHHIFKLVNVKGYYGQNTMAKNLIKINVNLVHFHDDVIKSVMYHELAHDFVANHSKDFYAKLQSFDPNYKVYRKIITSKNYERTLL